MDNDRVNTKGKLTHLEDLLNMQDDRLSQFDKEIYERLLGVHTKMSSIKTTARSSTKTAEQLIVEQAKELRRDSLILHKEGKAYAETGLKQWRTRSRWPGSPV